ncbi:MAG: hypothetical protein LW884_03360 [Bacteroidetes bacterium]|jgi:uncharacterized protein involved in exopolysaccharide biosynthesis|nr:hypothetical protein [Bacteroidota bacterium]
MSKPEISLLFVIDAFRQGRRWILGITLLSAIVATVVVLLVNDYYRSRLVLFPYSPKTSDPRTLFFDEAVYDVFGEKADVDRIVSLGMSRKTIDRTVKELKLMSHWELEGKENSQDKLYKKWDKHVTIRRDDYGALEILAEDEDPEMAAKIVNTHAWFIDRAFKEGIEKNNYKELSIYKKNVLGLRKELDSLTKILDVVLERNPRAQVQEFGVVGAGSSKDAVRIFALVTQLGVLNTSLAENIRRTNEVEAAIKGDIRSVLVVQPGEKAEIKYGPQRTLIILGATAATFFLMLLIACGKYYYRRLVIQPGA